MQQEQLYRRLTQVTTGFFILFGIVMAVYNIFHSTPYYIFLSVASIAFAFLPFLFFKLVGVAPAYSVVFWTDVFCFFTFSIGMVFHGYTTIPFYDKMMHTVTGFFFGYIGLMLFYLLKPSRKIDRSEAGLVSLFTVSFAMLIAVAWETFEFTINLFLHNDPQRVAETGVNDTMGDILVCLAGALVFALCQYLAYKKDKKIWMVTSVETLLDQNTAREPRSKESEPR